MRDHGKATHSPEPLAFRVVDSPIGALLLAGGTAGIARVAFECEDHAQVLTQLEMTAGGVLSATTPELDALARQIDDYFAGRRREFDTGVDLRFAVGFRRRVLTELSKVPYGQRISYTGLAVAAGSARAARGVGTACALNPVPLVVPCHRVVRAD